VHTFALQLFLRLQQAIGQKHLLTFSPNWCLSAIPIKLPALLPIKSRRTFQRSMLPPMAFMILISLPGELASSTVAIIDPWCKEPCKTPLCTAPQTPARHYFLQFRLLAWSLNCLCVLWAPQKYTYRLKQVTLVLSLSRRSWQHCPILLMQYQW